LIRQYEKNKHKLACVLEKRMVCSILTICNFSFLVGSIMVYKELYSFFVDDKHRFFAEIVPQGYRPETATAEVKRQAKITAAAAAKKRALDTEHGYRFIAKNFNLISQELDELQAALNAKDADRDAFWLYAYYCSILLQHYYRIYGQEKKAEDFRELRIRLKKRYVDGQFPELEEQTFTEYLTKSIKKGFDDLLKAPLHVSSIRNSITLSNMLRLNLAFTRLSVTKSLVLARDLLILDKVASALGKQIDVDNILHTLEAPTEVFRGLSVGLFAARFIMNVAMILKHTFAPSKQEKNLSRLERFSNEVCKRHGSLANDAVWGPINLITNYNTVFGISATAAGWITVGFLLFDFCLIAWLRHLAEKEYLTKRAQYDNELEYYQQQVIRGSTREQREMAIMQCAVISRQQTEHNNSWQAQSSTFWFQGAAALLLLLGFSAAMLLATPIMLIACYFLCAVAVAMYMSSEAFGNYQKERIALQQVEIDERNENSIEKASKKCAKARNEFIFTLLENALMPALLMATFAICWQVAIVLAAVYLVYKISNAVSKAHDKYEKDRVVDNKTESGIEMQDFKDEDNLSCSGSCFSCG
jgi:hypothetical protein